MDPFERYHRRSLRDVLVGQGVLSQEEADELVEAAYESNEPFGAVLVDAGHLTAWDLVKLVSTHYQMPVMPLSGYDFDPEMFEVVSPATLYHHQMVPVGRFGRAWAFSVVEPGRAHSDSRGGARGGKLERSAGGLRPDRTFCMVTCTMFFYCCFSCIPGSATATEKQPPQ